MIRSVTPKASPEPTAETRNNTDEMTIVGTRPNLLDTGPANHAPTAQPSSAEETAKPWSHPPRLKSADSALTAPLMTEVSNPNRNPPMAAATEMPITRGLNRVAFGASLTFFRTFLTWLGACPATHTTWRVTSVLSGRIRFGPAHTARVPSSSIYDALPWQHAGRPIAHPSARGTGGLRTRL